MPKPNAEAPTLDERWGALLRRDRSRDGTFVYSVESTGVYCRPSCAARRPRPENVRFHETCEDAERAGFRPCKRCHPDDASQTERQTAMVADACRAIAESETPPTLAELASAAGVSRFHFHRVFKGITGVTPKAYADAARGRRMRDELARCETVTQAIYGAGFNSNGRFYAAAPNELGMTPTAFRAGGDGAVIRFAVDRCSLGAILVAATDRGVCAIEFGDDADGLVDAFKVRFANARLDPGDDGFQRMVARVIAFVEAPGHGLDLPLDIRGTIFQRRVWQAIRDIPSGTTASYTEIARRIGQPNAVRAVARACASNAIAVAIPCHRVVASNGSLAGYRWGLERKSTLIEREKPD